MATLDKKLQWGQRINKLSSTLSSETFAVEEKNRSVISKLRELCTLATFIAFL